MRYGLLLALLLAACDGLREVTDTSIADAGQHELSVDAHTNSPDAQGPLAAGGCCAKPADCSSGQCDQVGTGPPYCSKTCTVSSDDCPVGFGCDPGLLRCVPPPAGPYQCGPHVVAAKPQPLGGCCGKISDCVGGSCINVGDGAYFCSQSCTRSPDNCPTGFACSSLGTPLCVSLSTSTCAYK